MSVGLSPSDRANTLRLLGIRFKGMYYFALGSTVLGTIGFGYYAISNTKDAPDMIWAIVATLGVFVGAMWTVWLWQALSVGLYALADISDRVHRDDKE